MNIIDQILINSFVELPSLPASIVDREENKWYSYKNNVYQWKNNLLHCIHSAYTGICKSNCVPNLSTINKEINIIYTQSYVDSLEYDTNDFEEDDDISIFD
jgi:hypothetical protein